jgi:hypothetical protein
MDSHVRFWDPRTYKQVNAIENAFEGQQITSISMTPDSQGILTSAAHGGIGGPLSYWEIRL